MGTYSNLVTIVIPTMNRLDWVYRTLDFYQKFNLLHPILIGDSSNKAKNQKLKKYAEKYSNLKINIFHFPNLNAEQVTFELSKLVKTKYVTFLADDDIILPSFFNIAVKELSEDKKLSGVSGRSYCFSNQKNNLYGEITSFGEYPIIDSQENNYFDRISRNLTPNYACIFSIVRISVFIKALKKINELNKYHQTFILGELLCSIEYLKQGKIRKLKHPFILRQQHNENNYGNRKLYEWLRNDFVNSYNFILKNLLSNSLNIKKKQILEKLFDNFIKSSIGSMPQKKNKTRIYNPLFAIRFKIKFSITKLFFSCYSKNKELTLLLKYLSKC